MLYRELRITHTYDRWLAKGFLHRKSKKANSKKGSCTHTWNTHTHTHTHTHTGTDTLLCVCEGSEKASMHRVRWCVYTHTHTHTHTCGITIMPNCMWIG